MKTNNTFGAEFLSRILFLNNDMSYNPIVIFIVNQFQLASTLPNF